MEDPQGTPVKVIVTDIDISFGQLVVLMVKAALAAIPATLVLCAVAGALYVVATSLARF